MRPPRCEGFSLVSAVFLLVVLTAAGAAMVRVGAVQRATATFGVLAPKAYHAARSGIEWQAYQALNVPGSCPVGVTTTTAFMLTEAGLDGFRVTVDCTSEIHVEAGVPATLYRVTALAEWDLFGGRDYVSRRLQTTLSDAP